MQRPRRESVLATVLFTDIVGSSDVVAELGDRRWRILLSRHHALVRRELRRHGGRELDTAGDGFFASFENPGNAIRCAAAVVEAVQELGIDVRIGPHLGQAEIVGRKLGGQAVHIGARVMARAGPAEVLVTGVLKDVLPASDFKFEDRGGHTLKGVPGEWRVFRVTAVERPLPGPLEPSVAAERREAIQAPPMQRSMHGPPYSIFRPEPVGCDPYSRRDRTGLTGEADPTLSSRGDLRELRAGEPRHRPVLSGLRAAAAASG